MSGPFQGRGVLAIWNGIAPEAEEEFLRWHAGEHLPERIAVPGFLRARRYVAISGSPKYFNFYEVEGAEVLSSAPYLERLNDPSDWTQAVVPHFTDTSRTLCDTLESRGHGCGGVVATLRIDAEAERLRGLLAPLSAHPDITGAHLLGRHEAPAAASSESQMRSAPDASSRAILLVEGLDAERLEAAMGEVASDEAISDLCGIAPEARGLYRLDFLLDRGCA